MDIGISFFCLYLRVHYVHCRPWALMTCPCTRGAVVSYWPPLAFIICRSVWAVGKYWTMLWLRSTRKFLAFVHDTKHFCHKHKACMSSMIFAEIYGHLWVFRRFACCSAIRTLTTWHIFGHVFRSPCVWIFWDWPVKLSRSTTAPLHLQKCTFFPQSSRRHNDRSTWLALFRFSISRSKAISSMLRIQSWDFLLVHPSIIHPSHDSEPMAPTLMQVPQMAVVAMASAEGRDVLVLGATDLGGKSTSYFLRTLIQYDLWICVPWISCKKLGVNRPLIGLLFFCMDPSKILDPNELFICFVMNWGCFLDHFLRVLRSGFKENGLLRFVTLAVVTSSHRCEGLCETIKMNSEVDGHYSISKSWFMLILGSMLVFWCFLPTCCVCMDFFIEMQT